MREALLNAIPSCYLLSLPNDFPDCLLGNSCIQFLQAIWRSFLPQIGHLPTPHTPQSPPFSLWVGQRQTKAVEKASFWQLFLCRLTLWRLFSRSLMQNAWELWMFGIFILLKSALQNQQHQHTNIQSLLSYSFQLSALWWWTKGWHTFWDKEIRFQTPLSLISHFNFEDERKKKLWK